MQDLRHAAVRHLQTAADVARADAHVRQLDYLNARLVGQRAPVDEGAAQLIHLPKDTTV